MAASTGFFIWTEDEPIVYPRGEKAKILDGCPISLYHTLKNYFETSGKDISDVDFKIELEENGQTLAEHSFKMNVMDTIWLVVDPSASDANGSFTPVFLNIFANASAGTHNYTVKFYTDDELLNIGELEYESDGNNNGFKTLLPKFENVAATRMQANLQHQQEYMQQLEEEETKQKAEREYNIFIENADIRHTKYVIVMNKNLMSETIIEILPNMTSTLELDRGVVYDLKFYDQDVDKELAQFIDEVDETYHNSHYVITQSNFYKKV